MKRVSFTSVTRQIAGRVVARNLVSISNLNYFLYATRRKAAVIRNHVSLSLLLSVPMFSRIITLL